MTSATEPTTAIELTQQQVTCLVTALDLLLGCYADSMHDEVRGWYGPTYPDDMEMAQRLHRALQHLPPP
jgi:hypothetical protein